MDGNKPTLKPNVDCLKRNLKATPLHRQPNEERDEEGISDNQINKLFKESQNKHTGT